MKEVYAMILLTASLSITSCSDWLDVAPNNQVNGSKLFEVGDGYRNALNGIYLNLGTSSTYDKSISWGFMDIIAQYYQLGSSYMENTSSYYKAANYKFDDSDVKNIISSIWSVGYNNTANCNDSVANVSEASPSVFAKDEPEKNMIWGETLGLRALIYFDILRVFAPSMPKDGGKAYIPYVDVYPTIVPSYENNKEILRKIVNDLKAVKDLLARCDAIKENKHWIPTENRMLAVNSGTSGELAGDVFFAHRGYRMNYYAVTAMLARVYCWAGEYDNVYKEAKEVVDATYSTGSTSTTPCFNFSNSLTTNRKDYDSIIMTFFKSTCYGGYPPYTTKGNDVVLVVNTTNLFGDEVGADDRNLDLFGDWDGGDIKYSFEYDIKEGTSGTDAIPAIRLSEMHCIMSEYFAYKDEFSKAGEMLDKVHYVRCISTANLAPSIGSLEVFHTHLIKEIRREFVGEGQMLFQYKRLDQKPKDNVVFVFDKPNNEGI